MWCFLLGGIGASVALPGEMGIPTFYATEIELKPDSITGGDGTFIVNRAVWNGLFANTAFVPNGKLGEHDGSIISKRSRLSKSTEAGRRALRASILLRLIRYEL